VPLPTSAGPGEQLQGVAPPNGKARALRHEPIEASTGACTEDSTEASAEVSAEVSVPRELRQTPAHLQSQAAKELAAKEKEAKSMEAKSMEAKSMEAKSMLPRVYQVDGRKGSRLQRPKAPRVGGDPHER